MMPKAVFITFFCLIFKTQVFAQEYIQFSASELEGFTTPQGGAFIDIVSSILASDTKYAMNTKFEPAQSIVAKAIDGKLQCILGGSLNLLKFYGLEKKNFIESNSFWPIRYVFYTNHSKEKINNLKDLQSKRIGVYRSDMKIFKKYLPADSNIVEMKTKRQLYNALNSGKIDVALDAYPLLPKYSSSVHFNPDLLLIEFNNSILCAKSEVNQNFINHFNSLLDSKSSKEKVIKIYDRYYK